MHGRGEDETGCPRGEGEGFNGGKDDAWANVLERSMIAEGFKSMTGMTGISSIRERRVRGCIFGKSPALAAEPLRRAKSGTSRKVDECDGALARVLGAFGDRKGRRRGQSVKSQTRDRATLGQAIKEGEPDIPRRPRCGEWIELAMRALTTPGRKGGRGAARGKGGP